VVVSAMSNPNLPFLIANVAVYVDADGTMFDASLNQTNIGNNNNKAGKRAAEVNPKLTTNSFTSFSCWERRMENLIILTLAGAE